MTLEFIDNRAKRRLTNMLDINKIRDILDDENAYMEHGDALIREEIWEESQAEIWEQRGRNNG